MNTDQVKVRVIVFKDGEGWIAQCLDYDICAQGPDLTTVKRRFDATVLADLNESVRRFNEPFKGIDPAPSWAQAMWSGDDGAFLSKGEVPSASQRPVSYEMALIAA